MRLIKDMANNVALKYKTREPTEIARRKGIVVMYEPFKTIYGYYNASNRIEMIHVNQNLGDDMRRFVIAHELGHRMLHPHINVPFLRANTLQSIEKIEWQANKFAVELLIPDELLADGMTIYDAAAACGVPGHLAEIKIPPKIEIKIWTGI